jgi:hypothetical protein
LLLEIAGGLHDHLGFRSGKRAQEHAPGDGGGGGAAP